MRSVTRTDGLDYYEYILLYIDNFLCISENPEPALLQVYKNFPSKPASVGPPKTYLGGTVSKIQLPSGVHAWEFSSSQYVHEVVKRVEEHHEKEGKRLIPKKPCTPIPTSDCP